MTVYFSSSKSSTRPIDTHLPLLAEIPDGDDSLLAGSDELVVPGGAGDGGSSALVEIESLNLTKKTTKTFSDLGSRSFESAYTH